GKRENKNSFTDRKIVVEEYYPLDGADLKYNVDALIPLYSLTKGLTQKFLRTCQANALQNYLTDEEEVLPLDLLKKRGLLQAKQAIKAIHFPVSVAELENARRRLIYEEFLLMTLAFNLKARQKFISQKPYQYTLTKKYLTPFKNNLGFNFTPSQIKVINEIFKDMMSPTPMTRLVQGDVGSGKTVVAISALLLAVESGKQGAFMAPTEILATQHFITLNKYLKPLGVNTALLTSKTTAKERQTLLDKLAKGEIQILIGTHAFIEDKVKFKDLTLVIVDEQHRFGVKQRAKLRQKSAHVDMLSMTATPIPRTFALAFYGDLDVSTISELPKGRQEIKTFHTSEAEAFFKAKEAVLRGEQVYIVYPLIDESDKLELKAVTAEFEAAKTKFPDFKLGLIHGAMKPKEKQKIMEDFLAKKIDILFATPVIEVGIDVKNATVMIIENAERFGLASLHQLRGRIGRGDKASTCYLVTKNLSTVSKERINIICQTCDGFKIGEKDLEIRGPGEILGTRQSGELEFKAGDIIRDKDVLKWAVEDRDYLVNKDFFLTMP
ncbi:MAG: ATP-dependent DNA helicase RecG, partial [Elusimicrobiaceae bacterium]|nr:ATP-dependent DNA helicase RecG [Elusimicrobiaceae bacterium]